MRMRGYDVVARPVHNLATDDFANNHWKETFKDISLEENLPSTGRSYIIQRRQKFGDGSRTEVYIAWNFDDSFHVFVAENMNGAICFLDPQTGELDAEYYFDNVENGYYQLK